MDIITASKNRDGQLDHTFKSSSRHIDDVLSLMNLFSAHICILSIHMTLKQRIQPTLKIMFLLRPLPLHPNRRKILNKILRYKWWFHFSNCRCLIHMQQYYRSTSVWGLHFTTHPLFWGLCPIQCYYRHTSAADAKATQQSYAASRIRSSI